MAKSSKKSNLTPRQANWLRLFIDESNPKTFLNKTESARQAGYKCSTNTGYGQVGYENYKKLYKKIGKWLDEVGLSDEYLKQKLKYLMEAKMTKFFAFQGRVIDEKEVEALETQRQSLDMALKVKGLYAPEKQKHSGTIKIIVEKE